MRIMAVRAMSEEVRRLVLQQFQTYGGGPIDEGAVEETILIRNGRYHGRSYRTSELLAMWLVEIGLVQFYSEAGRMLGTFHLDERPAAAAETRRAA